VAEVTQYVLVVAFGLLIGVAELTARYRDAPARAVLSLPALLYLGLNGAASATALALIHGFGWSFGLEATNAAAVWWTQVMVAGFGAMALFRSSLLMIRVGTSDVSVGPGGILQVVLDAADRAVDRTRAGPRADAVARIMQDVSFARAQIALPTLCFSLMQNVPEEEQRRLLREISELEQAPISDAAKALSLGLSLMSVVGETVLAKAVEKLGAEIRREEE